MPILRSLQNTEQGLFLWSFKEYDQFPAFLPHEVKLTINLDSGQRFNTIFPLYHVLNPLPLGLTTYVNHN